MSARCARDVEEVGGDDPGEGEDAAAGERGPADQRFVPVGLFGGSTDEGVEGGFADGGGCVSEQGSDCCAVGMVGDMIGHLGAQAGAVGDGAGCIGMGWGGDEVEEVGVVEQWREAQERIRDGDRLVVGEGDDQVAGGVRGGGEGGCDGGADADGGVGCEGC